MFVKICVSTIPLATSITTMTASQDI